MFHITSYEVIYSGGGFSNYFPRPSYQEAAVDSYFASYTPSYSTTLYNGTGRGFPDISANGCVIRHCSIDRRSLTPLASQRELRRRRHRRLLPCLRHVRVRASHRRDAEQHQRRAFGCWKKPVSHTSLTTHLAMSLTPQRGRLGFINPALYSADFADVYNVSSLILSGSSRG